MTAIGDTGIDNGVRKKGEGFGARYMSMELTHQLNNREWALIVWGAVALICMLCHAKIRASILDLVVVFFHKKILLTLAAMILYVAVVVALLYKLDFWEPYLVKDTGFWLIGTALTLMIGLPSATQDEHYFMKSLLDNLKVILVLEFVLNLYAFSFWIEMILFPLLLVVVLFNAFAERSKRPKAVKKVTNFILSVYALAVISFSLLSILNNFQSFASLENIRAFTLPPLLTITFIPFLYMLALYMAYENMSPCLRACFFDDKELVEYGRKVVFRLCHFNLVRLERFARWSPEELMRVRNKDDIIKVTLRFRRRERLSLRMRRLVRRPTEPG